MRPIIADRVASPIGQSICRSVTFLVVSPAKTAEAIEMPFGLWARVGLRNHVLDGGSDALTTMGTFWGASGQLQSIGVLDWVTG